MSGMSVMISFFASLLNNADSVKQRMPVTKSTADCINYSVHMSFTVFFLASNSELKTGCISAFQHWRHLWTVCPGFEYK